MTAVDYKKEVEDCVLRLMKDREKTPPGTVAFIREHASQEMKEGLARHKYLPSV